MYITIDIGGTNTRVASFNGLDITTERSYEIFDTSKDFQTGLYNIINAINQAKGTFNVESIALAHIGDINPQKTLMTDSSKIPEYNNKPLKDLLAKEFQTEVFLENDSVCAGLGEYVFGMNANAQRFAYMTISTGLGAVFIKRLGHGTQVLMADVGHIMVMGERRRCICGRIDCIEAYVSGKSLSDRYLKSADKIDDLRIWEEAVDYLSIASVSLITMFKPTVLVFGGGMIENNDYIKHKLTKEVESQLRGVEMPEISISNFKDKVGVYGGLALIKLNPSNLV